MNRTVDSLGAFAPGTYALYALPMYINKNGM